MRDACFLSTTEQASTQSSFESYRNLTLDLEERLPLFKSGEVIWLEGGSADIARQSRIACGFQREKKSALKAVSEILVEGNFAGSNDGAHKGFFSCKVTHAWGRKKESAFAGSVLH